MDDFPRTTVLKEASYHIFQHGQEWNVALKVADKSGKVINFNLPLNVEEETKRQTFKQHAGNSSRSLPEESDVEREELARFEESMLCDFHDDKTLSQLNDSWNDILANFQAKEKKSLFEVHASQEYMNLSKPCLTSVENDTQELSYPHVPYTVEELSFVETLEAWSNTNVRVIGKIIFEGESDTWSLKSTGEDGGSFSIRVDISLLEKEPPENSTVQVFGELRITENTSVTPYIVVKFFRVFDSVDLYYYNASIDVLKKRIPYFVKRRK